MGIGSVLAIAASILIIRIDPKHKTEKTTEQAEKGLPTR